MNQLNNKFRILFAVLSMILSVHALEISILNVRGGFKCKTKIKTNIAANKEKIYDKTSLQPIYYQAFKANSTIIVHVVNITRYEDIAIPNAVKNRWDLAEILKKDNYELVVLGIENCEPDEVSLIHYFIWDIIYRNESAKRNILLLEEPVREFLTGYFREKALWEEEFFSTSPIPKCQGETWTFLEKYLTEKFPKMKYNSKRSDQSEIKKVLFYEFSPPGINEYSRIPTWPLSIENGEYNPVDGLRLDTVKDNFWRRYRNHTMHILIVDGKTYDWIKSRVGLFEEFKRVRNELFERGHILFIMACFNFEWSDIDIVHQIILKHSVRPKHSEAYKVFTIGIGMFATLFTNPYPDERQLPRTTEENVLEFAKKCNRGASISESKAFEIFDLYSMSGSQATVMNFTLLNGRYVPQGEFSEYRLSTQYPNMNFAFIVVDSTEKKRRIDFGVLQTQTKKLMEDNKIVIFLIEPSHWELYDLHIIPQWVEKHRGDVHPNRIKILGGGKFYTFYQYSSRLYQVSYTPLVVPVELKAFRNHLMNTIENKDVFVFKLDSTDPKFEVRKHPMHTINGFYDPVRLSNKDIFESRDVPNIMFIIMEADKLNPAATEKSLQVQSVTELRHKIRKDYPVETWAIYLVGFRNFGENDSHLFAEFVQMHTINRRPLSHFVHTYRDIAFNQSEYVYKDTSPIFSIRKLSIAVFIRDFLSEFDTVFDLIKDL